MFKAIAALAGLASAGLLIGAAWFVFHLIQHEQQLADQLRAANDKAAEAKAQGQLDSASARTAAGVVTQLQPIIQREKETVSEIQTAPGSDALVDPRSAGAFYRGLCAQPWRAGDAVCRPDDHDRSEPAPAVQPSAAPDSGD